MVVNRHTGAALMQRHFLTTAAFGDAQRGRCEAIYDVIGALLILSGTSSIATGLVYGAVQFGLDLLL